MPDQPSSQSSSTVPFVHPPTGLTVEVDARAAVDALAAELAKARALLQRLREWDHMQTAGDGPYWLGEIGRVLDA